MRNAENVHRINMRVYKVVFVLSKDQAEDDTEELNVKTVLAETLEKATVLAIRMMRSDEIPQGVRRIAVLNANDESECHEIRCTQSSLLL